MTTRELARTPNNVPYETSLVPPTVVPPNSVITSTGNSFPQPTIQGSSITAGTFSNVSQGFDLDPVNPNSQGWFRNPTNNNQIIIGSKSITLYNSTNSERLGVDENYTFLEAGGGQITIKDGNNSYGNAGDVLTSNGAVATWQAIPAPFYIKAHWIISNFCWGTSVGATFSFYPSNDLNVEYWYSSTAPPPNPVYSTSNNQDFGNVVFSIDLAGTHQICIPHGTPSNGGILDFTLDGNPLISINEGLGGLKQYKMITLTLTQGDHILAAKCNSTTTIGYDIQLWSPGISIDYIKP